MVHKLLHNARLLLASPAAWCGAIITAALLWVFWPTLAQMAARWGSDPRYSHGYLVPLFAAYLLWARCATLSPEAVRPSVWGLPLLLAGLGMRFAGTYLFFDWLAAIALLPCLGGIVLLLGGWRVLRGAWPALAFLGFMVPLPFRLEVALSQPLQRLATKVSTYALQTLGVAAFSEGNVIRIGPVRIGVVEACSGLSMLVIFFALSTAASLLIARRWPVKLLIFVSAIPIALLANITRIVVTAILHKTVGSELANYVFHDLAGWLMMPFALALLWLELRLLDWVFPAPTKADEPEALTFGWDQLGAARPAARPQTNPAPTASNAVSGMTTP